MCSSRLRAISVALLVGVVGTAAAVSAVPAQAEGHGDTRINKAVANHGEAVVVGPSVATTYPIRLSISDSSSWPPTATTRRTRWRETGGSTSKS